LKSLTEYPLAATQLRSCGWISKTRWAGKNPHFAAVATPSGWPTIDYVVGSPNYSKRPISSPPEIDSEIAESSLKKLENLNSLGLYSLQEKSKLP